MEPVEVAKVLILGKFAKPLAERLYGGTSIDKIEIYLARDLRVVNREAQQRFVAVIGPGMGIDPSASNVFGVLTPTIDDVLNYTLKSGYALQVGFNYGKVSGGWRRGAKALYSSELYALEKIIVEVEGKDESALGEAKAVAKRLVDGLLSYVDDVYVEYSGHKSYYLGLWLPEPITGIKAGVNISLSDLYRGLGLRLVKGLGKRERSLIDRQYINAVKLLRVPGFKHEETGKPAQFLDIDLKPAEFDPGVMERAVVSRGLIMSVVSSMVIAVEDTRPMRPKKRVKLGKVAEWDMVIRYMLKEGIKANDGRVRFSYVLGNWCAAKHMSFDQCRELHSKLIEGVENREYQRYLEYGYQHPEYLPWPYMFFKGSEWYSVPDVEVFRNVYEALGGRVTRHVEVKHTPRPEAGQPKPSEVRPTPKPEVEPKQSEVEVKTEASPKPKPEVKVEAGLWGHSSEGKAKPDEAKAAGSSTGGAKAPVGEVEVNTPNPNANAATSETTKTGAEANPKASEPKSKAEVDVGKIVELTKPWLAAAGYGDLIGRLESIIRRIVTYIIERGVVGEWELWDMFLRNVAEATGSSDEAWLEMLFTEIISTIELIMEWLGVLKVERNILMLVGSGVKPSEAKVGVSEAHKANANSSKPVATGASSNADSGAKAREPAVEPNTTEPKSSSPEPKIEPNQGSQAGPATGAHWSGGMARINIGDFINHGEAPTGAITIRQSIIHGEAVEAPVNIATVDRIARRLCNSEDCIVSARLAVTFIIGAVGKGPVRVGWLEDAFKSRHPIHYEVLRSEGINMWVILTQLKGLGIVVVGDIATPGGWHSKWVTGLVARLLEARGRVNLSELVELVRESEPDLPDAFVGGVTLGDHVALAVKYLEWRGTVKIEGKAVTLVK
jgi:hypothetical protein